eukprot:TRINITY_DN55477_c0_g1_i1.p1 TRINITY_DN55477_c0_g1~~TRINITY_DN55477_c0_g1_i1.p1  ORF type:complete len:980 (+),score=370.28 TRINITY_DN55477_c0_g1_i1:88-2940(+)
METVRHDVNCLQDSRIDTRWKALQRLQRELEGLSEADDDAKQRYAQEIVKPLLRMLDDRRDRHRELAAELVRLCLPMLDFDCLDWVLPVLSARLAQDPSPEESEPVRHELMRLVIACVETFPHDIAPRGFLEYFTGIITQSLRDRDPDMRKACCRCVLALCAACREKMKPVAMGLAKAIKSSLQFKQWPVRVEAVRAFSKLIGYGAIEIIYDFREEPVEIKTTLSYIRILTCDRSESVRQATLDMIADWTMEIPERLDTHRWMIPSIMLALTDDIESVRRKAQRIIVALGKFYEMDNEDNRIDLERRRISLKDIQWYTDEKYPDMTMSCRSTLPIPDLNCRPPLGSRSVVADACRNFIPKLLEDIVALEWNIPNSSLNRRIVALRILIMTIWFNEANNLQYMQAILDALYKVMRDEDPVVRTEAQFTLELLGKFHTPSNYIPLILAQAPADGAAGGEGAVTLQQRKDDDEVEHREVRRRTLTIFSTTAATTKVSILIAFRFLLKGATELSVEQAKLITRAVTSNDIVDLESPEQLLALLDLISVFQEVLAHHGYISRAEPGQSPTSAAAGGHADPAAEPAADGCADTGRDAASPSEQTSLDFLLFWTLLDITASQDAKVVKRAEEVVAELSVTVTGSPQRIYDLHFARALREKQSMPIAIFERLLRNGKELCARYTGDIVETFLVHLHSVRYDVDVRDQLRYMTLLHDFLLDAKEIGCKLELQHLEELLLTVIFPNGRWHVGGAAHLFRKVALGCLGALLVQRMLPSVLWEPEMTAEDRLSEEGRQKLEAAAGLLTTTIECWRNCLDDDDPELRMVVVKAMPHVMLLPMTAVEAAECMKEFLARMDDSNDAIRKRTAACIKQCYAALREGKLPKHVASVLSQKEGLTEWINSLLLHMDDPSVELKEGVCAALLEIAAVDGPLVRELASRVREKHMTTRLCDRLIAESMGS